MKRKFGLVIILLLILAGFFSYRVKIKNYIFNLTKEKIPVAIEFNNENQQVNQNQKDQPQTSNIKTNLPALPDFGELNRAAGRPNEPQNSLNLKVPFTSQAPTSNWDPTFKEACEETVALMVDYYYQNKTFTPEIATAEILKMVDWQIKNFNGHFDLTATQTAELIKKYFGYTKVEIVDYPTIEDIKNQIAAGRPVIVPAAGQLLGNPYFRNPGPIYHMLVIKGYTADKFITNDPGTKRGQDYLYDFKTIMAAMHDWNSEDINQGAKRVIVIYPN